MRVPTEFRLKITPRSTSSTTPPSGDLERRADREIVNMSVASQGDSGSSQVARPLLCGSVRELTLRQIKGGFGNGCASSARSATRRYVRVCISRATLC